MTAYLLLSGAQRTLVLALAALLTYLELLLLFGCISLRHLRRLPAAAAAFLGCFMLLCLLAFGHMRAAALTNRFPLWNLPWGVIAAALLLAGADALRRLAWLVHSYRNSITAASVKESVDNLPIGLCFAWPGGDPLLVNHRMEALCRTFTGRPLLDANALWQSLGACALPNENPPSDAVRICRENARVWTFRKEHFRLRGQTVIQLTALDTTELYAYSQKLRQENAALKAMRDRLLAHNSAIEELTRSEELLAAKVRIHDELGRALLATRYELTRQDGSWNAALLLEQWQCCVALLQREAVAEPAADLLTQFSQAAQAVGVTVSMTGNFPQNDPPAARLLLLAGRECLTNAVRHAAADRLDITIQEDGGGYRAVFGNNGAVPAGPIREGGGLGNLRRRVETAGGQMEIETAPRFLLTIWVPGGGTALCFV